MMNACQKIRQAERTNAVTIPIDQTIHHFVSLAIQDGWLDPLDYDYTVNQLLARLALDGLDSCEQALAPELTLLDYLDQLEAYALEHGLILDSAFGREAFEPRCARAACPRPTAPWRSSRAWTWPSTAAAASSSWASTAPARRPGYA